MKKVKDVRVGVNIVRILKTSITDSEFKITKEKILKLFNNV